MNENLTTSGEEAPVRAVVEDWADAVRRRDLPAVLGHHAGDIVMFDVAPPFQSKGTEAYATSWELFFAWSREPVVYDITEMRVAAGDDVAFVSAAMRCSGTEPGGDDVDLDFRLTIGLCRIDGRWTIVHEHHSIPATS